MIAAVATARNCFSLPVIIPSRLFAADVNARGSAAGNITAASFTPMPSITRSVGVVTFHFQHHKSRMQSKSRILRLLDLNFLREGTNVVLIGKPKALLQARPLID